MGDKKGKNGKNCRRRRKRKKMTEYSDKQIERGPQNGYPTEKSQLKIS